MAMKIDQMLPSHNIAGRRNENSKESHPESVIGGKTDARAETGVRVTLTDSANNLADHVKSADGGLSEASLERIERLRNTINSDSYEINSQKIAKKIMDFELALR